MNKPRRKELETVQEKLTEMKEMISDILADEQDYFDNIPENLQNSERAENSQIAIDSLENIDSLIEEIDNYINDAINC